MIDEDRLTQVVYATTLVEEPTLFALTPPSQKGSSTTGRQFQPVSVVEMSAIREIVTFLRLEASIQLAGRRLALLQNVIEKAPTPRLKANRCHVAGKNPRHEHFERVFLANYPRVLSVLRRIVGDHARAEDLANEVFLKLYRQPMPAKAIDNVPAWLYRTATNLGIDALRSSARRYRYEEAAARAEIKASIAESALDQSLKLEKQERVRAVLADLKPVQAQLLLLRASGHSYKEVAETLDLEVGTVGTRLVRAEAAFEERYIELYGREEKL